ncbi:AAA family ATPase [Oleisolibacter albus]|uniref:AAA family ATPase n=1 Tax=Oleisolibacter albus TaxID=2171757 RepID=UPI00138FD30B|nr:AAA family ATPase [Oleisolibacter albus]
MSRAAPRLGITGSAGTGKTTLAAAVACRLAVPVLPEAMRALLEQGFDLHSLSRDQHRDLLCRQADALACDLARIDGGLVSDRTPLDMAAFWLSNGYGVDDPAATEALLARAIMALADYSHIVLLPWGAMPLAADGVRSPNPWLQLHFQTIIEGLCRRWVEPARLIALPETAMAPEARCAFVLERLAAD